MTLSEEVSIIAGLKFNSKEVRSFAKISKSELFAERFHKVINLS